MKRALFGLFLLIPVAGPLWAQGTQADYDRALGLRKKYEALVGNAAEAPRWVGRTHKVYYRRSLKGGQYEIRARAVDGNGFAQPQPRPSPKSGRNAIQVRRVSVG